MSFTKEELKQLEGKSKQIVKNLLSKEWDSNVFSELIAECLEKKNFKLLKAARRFVFKSTMKYIELNLKNNNRYKDSLKKTRKYRVEDFQETFEKREEKTTISVHSDDCVNVAIELQDLKKCRVTILNMASFGNPGGGVENGAGAQEESLCRRSNLLDCLKKDDDSMYPINDGEVIFSKNVVFFRSAEKSGYDFLEKHRLFSIVTMPAVRRPNVDEEGKMDSKSLQRTLNKIRLIFNVCLQNNEKILVLSAMGCGAYGNPPKEVAKCFRKVLEEDEFSNRFEHVSFAILNDHNGPSNFESFREEFES